MNLETDYSALMAHGQAAFESAVEDTLREAQAIAPRVTGKFAGSLQRTQTRTIAGVLVSRIGSPLVSARVKENGGFMAARRHSTLFIPAGDGSVRRPQAVRVRATPTVTVAGPRFGRYFLERLKGTAIGAGGSAHRFGKADLRSGSVKI